MDQLSIEEAIKLHDKTLGMAGWGLQIYTYPPEGSAAEWASGRPVFTAHRYHINSGLAVSSSYCGIFTVSDDLAEGIMEILKWAQDNPDWVSNAGVNDRIILKQEERVQNEVPM